MSEVDYDTPGDLVKDGYDHALKSTGMSLWKGIQQVGLSGFGKGAALVALMVVGVTALLAGWMGSAEALSLIHPVTGNVVTHVTTFEHGFSVGIGKALEFLTSGLGLATLAIGGTLGAVSEAHSHINKNNATHAESIAQLQSRLRQHELEHQMQKAPVQNQTHEHHTHIQPAVHVEAPQPKEQQTGIRDKSFCASELKRRSEMNDLQHKGGIA